MEKEHYLNYENAQNKIQSWLQEIKFLKRHNPLVFKPERSALLVLDMQNIFVNPDFRAYIPTSSFIINPINSVIGAFRRNKLPVIFTRHTTSISPPNDPKKRDMMVKWWKNPIFDESPDSQIYTSMDVEDSSIINKHQYSAFFNTSLENILRGLDISQIVICGVMTHLCCETTARDGFMRGFEVFFLADGTASYTEKLHLGSLRGISHGFGKCTTVKNVLQILKNLDQENRIDGV